MREEKQRGAFGIDDRFGPLRPARRHVGRSTRAVLVNRKPEQSSTGSSQPESAKQNSFEPDPCHQWTTHPYSECGNPLQLSVCFISGLNCGAVWAVCTDQTLRVCFRPRMRSSESLV